MSFNHRSCLLTLSHRTVKLIDLINSFPSESLMIAFNTPSRSSQPSNTQHLINTIKRYFLQEEDNDLCDVVLVSSDGKRFPTLRALLAARSEYFHKLLYSVFKESTQCKVIVDISSSQLYCVLCFLLTGTLGGNGVEETIDIQTLIEARNAADYIDCQLMYDECDRMLLDLVRKNKDLLCFVYEAVYDQQGMSTIKLLDGLVDMIRNSPDETLRLGNFCSNRRHNLVERGNEESHGKNKFEQRGVTLLSKEALVTLFKNERLRNNIEEKKWFFIFQEWYMFNHHKSGGQLEPSIMHSLVDSLSITSLSASFINENMESSGLMSEKRLFEAYKYIACHKNRYHY